MSSKGSALLGLGMLLVGCGRGGGSAAEPAAPEMLFPGMTFGPQVLALDCTPKTGIAPLTSVCTVKGGHTAVATVVTCSLSVQGRVEELGDCTTALTRTVQLDNPGVVSVELTVKDPTFAIATAAVKIEAQPRPNTAPRIDAFTASPQEAVPPFTSTLSIAVTDAENDATTCRLDDGPSFPCSQTGQTAMVADIGAKSVVLTATDSLGLSSTKTLTLTGKAPQAALRISKIEWGQSVFSEQPKLVEGKPALLRVHVLNDKPGLDQVKVEAEVKSSAGTSKWVLTGPASPPIAEQPATLSQQWTVVVPGAMVAAGMEVTVKVDPDNAYVEADELDNVKVFKPAVGRGTVFNLTAVPVVNGANTGVPFDANPVMTRLWPVKAVDARPRAPYTFNGSLSGGSSAGWSTLLQGLAAARQADGSNRNYYGFVKVTYQAGVAGIGYVGQEAATGRDDSPDTLAHELGHNMGRSHAPCGGASGPDANYPYAGAKIGSWGYDSAGGKLISPTTHYDLMAYCPPEWVSDYNYKAVQQFLEAQPRIIGDAEMSQRIVVAGVLRAGKVTFRPVQKLLAAAGPAQDGTTEVKVTTVDGRTATAKVTLRDVGDLDEQHFTVLMPDVGRLASVELLSAGVTLHRVTAPEVAAPRYALTRLDASTLSLVWSEARFPTASIAHISDAGLRTTLGLWLDGGQVRVRTDGLTGGHFEVGFSDGVNSVRDALRVE